jgi:hypothetical protein
MVLQKSDPVDQSLYRQLIDSLMYLENTQPDIFLVGCLRYDIQLHGFIDSDWAGSANDKRSATWMYFSLSFATMLWASMKHKSVALNTAEAEYITDCDACTEAVWLHKLVSGLSDQVLNSTVIYCDDQSYVKLSENLVFHDRSKHIEIKHYILRDKVQRGEVVLQYISTDEQITIILVKPLSKMKRLHT